MIVINSNNVFADSKISAMTADTSPTSDDLIVTVNDPAGTPANRRVTLGDLQTFITSGGAGGWTDGGTNIYNTTTTDGVSIGTTTPSTGVALDVRGIQYVSGNIGINTISPGHRLDVNGNARILSTGALYFGSDNTAFLVGSAATTPNINMWISGNDIIDINSNGVVINEFSANSFVPLRIETDTDANAFYVNGTANNIGIGTFTTTSKLTVNGDVSVTDDVYAAGWNGSSNVPTKNAIYDKIETLSTSSGWTDGGTNIYLTDTSDKVGIGTTTPLNALDVIGGSTIGTYNDKTAPANGLIVTGNVGIGTFVNASRALIASATSTSTYNTTLSSSSTATLSINNNDSATGSAYQGLLFTTRNTTPTGFTAGGVVSVCSNKSSGSENCQLTFGVRTGGGYTERMRITGNNVGIGTTTANSQLSVSGGVQIGSTYNSTAAPTNGLIVVGNVGIGTTIPASPLTIQGNAVLQKVSAANTACTTTCGVMACFFGSDTGSSNAQVDCADATADVCFCSK